VCCVKDGKPFAIFALAVNSMKLEKINEGATSVMSADVTQLRAVLKG